MKNRQHKEWNIHFSYQYLTLRGVRSILLLGIAQIKNYVHRSIESTPFLKTENKGMQHLVTSWQSLCRSINNSIGNNFAKCNCIKSTIIFIDNKKLYQPIISKCICVYSTLARATWLAAKIKPTDTFKITTLELDQSVWSKTDVFHFLLAIS